MIIITFNDIRALYFSGRPNVSISVAIIIETGTSLDNRSIQSATKTIFINLLIHNFDLLFHTNIYIYIYTHIVYYRVVRYRYRMSLFTVQRVSLIFLSSVVDLRP